jgi:hypothetical protein
MATYTISTLQQLQDINSGHLADDCVLANDIDASATKLWNQGGVGHLNEYYGFVPIGAPSSAFTGTFNGQGHRITNLYVNRTHTNGATYFDKVGLFSDVAATATGKFIKDLTLENVDITGGTMVGGLVGEMQANTAGYLNVTNVNVTGRIEGTYGYLGTGSDLGVGGLAGVTLRAYYTDCSASTTIIGTVDRIRFEVFGGFDGHSVTGRYTNCSSSGTITLAFTTTADVFAGGFTGQTASVPIYSGCVSSVVIEVNTTGSTENRIGGFYGSGAGTTDSCFAYGNCTSLSIDPAYVGGFCGRTAAGGTVTKCGAEGNVENYSTNATENHSGGFHGQLSSGTATNCYAKGTVNLESGIGHADARIGGFCGESIATTTMTNCYSVGEVYSTGTPTNGGGFLGLDTAGTQTACFWDTQTSGWATSDGDATGKTTTQMKTQATFTAASWNFTDVWYISTFTRSPGLATTVWLSKVGDYENFEEGVKDADSFSLGIPTQDIILWTESLEALLLGTAGDEWMIGSNKLQTPISPTNFAVKQQSTYGSADIQAQKINEVLLFVDFVKRKIREMTFAADVEKFVSPDMTALADHITEAGVACMAHQKNPDSILWCVLDDGSLISLVYDRQQDVIAWSPHPIDGTVQSVCVTPGTNEDDVWISIKRTIDSSDKIYIEKMATRIQGDIENSFFVDSGIVVTGTSATISGLDHLEGETVVALVDGVYDGTFTVSSGDITLTTTPTAQAIVGLPYTAVLQPMRIIQNNQLGSSMASNTRVSALKVVFMNTKGAQYGDSTSNLFSFNFSDERLENANYVTGLFSGDVPVNMPGGFSTENPVVISSSQPYPMTVKAMIATFSQTGR